MAPALDWKRDRAMLRLMAREQQQSNTDPIAELRNELAELRDELAELRDRLDRGADELRAALGVPAGTGQPVRDYADDPANQTDGATQVADEHATT